MLGISQYNTIVKYLNDKYSPEEVKIQLYKRVDIYAFGILLLETTKCFIERTTPKAITSENLNIIKEIYKLGFECCYQHLETPDINTIMERLTAIVDIEPTAAASGVGVAASGAGAAAS